MPKLAQLKKARNIQDLAGLLGYKASGLAYIVYKIPHEEKYRSFKIPKKNGGQREILAPTARLKRLQKKLAELLQDCHMAIQESNFEKKKNTVSHGFLKGSSIKTNARPHVKQKYVFNFDLEDFFGSFNFGRVRGYFINSRDFSLHPKVATIIAQIACFNNKLPQGSPCSPIIATLIGNVLDSHLVRLARRNNIQYTRYADDISFSTYKKEFPLGIAKINSDGVWEIGKKVDNILKKSGFSANPKKTRMQYHSSRQVVTGLVVNSKPNVPNDYRKRVRAMVHSLCTKGTFEIDGVDGTYEQLHGMLAHIFSIETFNLANHKKHSAKQRNAALPIQPLFKKFLIYKEFFASSKPIILSEGKTDVMYLKAAISQLAMDFPKLASKNENGKTINNIRFFNFSANTTNEILGLNQGVGVKILKNILTYYLSTAYSPKPPFFKAPLKQKPFIFLVDNDSGSKDFFNCVRSVTKLKNNLDRKAPFIHVKGNIYVVPTPLLNGMESSEIEDFFDDSTRNMKLNGKTFNLTNNPSSSSQYGKTRFAKEIIRRANTINFEGFKPLLTNLSKAILDFEYLRKSNYF